MDFNSILNAPLQNQAIEKVDMPLIRMSGVPQVKVGVVGLAMQLICNHTQFHAIQE